LNGPLGQAEEKRFEQLVGLVGVASGGILRPVQLFDRFEKGPPGVAVVPQDVPQGGFVLYFFLLKLNALQPAERLAL
jgi:hypothetical protein